MRLLHEVASVFAVLDSMLLAYAGCVAAGRLAGAAISIACGVGVAYYVMPPIFSFDLSMHDAVTLAVYGFCCVGLIALKPGRGESESRESGSLPASYPHVSLKELLDEGLMVDLRTRGIAIAVHDVEFPATREEVARILTDLFTSAVGVTGVRRISIDGGVLPSARLLVVTAHRVWPPPMSERVTMGRHENKCEPVAFPRWPASLRASRFDNGYARVYQVFVEENGAQRLKIGPEIGW